MGEPRGFDSAPIASASVPTVSATTGGISPDAGVGESVTNAMVGAQVQSLQNRLAGAAVNTYTLTAFAVGNGTVTPAGATQVAQGGSQAYVILPSENWRIVDVLVDGLSVGAVTNYLFRNVAQSHTIRASFAVTQLVPGDIGIIGFNGLNNEDFSFVSLVPVAAGVVVKFSTDNDGSPGFLRYTTPAGGLPAGRVVVVNNPKAATAFASDGGTIRTNGYNYRGGGDRILVESGSQPVYVSETLSGYVPPAGLSLAGGTMISHPEARGVPLDNIYAARNGRYVGPRSGLRQQILVNIQNTNIWSYTYGNNAATYNFNQSPFNSAFTVTQDNSLKWNGTVQDGCFWVTPTNAVTLSSTGLVFYVQTDNNDALVQKKCYASYGRFGVQIADKHWFSVYFNSDLPGGMDVVEAKLYVQFQGNPGDSGKLRIHVSSNRADSLWYSGGTGPSVAASPEIPWSGAESEYVYDLTAVLNTTDKINNCEVLAINLGAGPTVYFDHFRLAVRYAPHTYSISASAGDNGSVTPTGVVQVVRGSSQPFAFVPAVHYHVADVLVDGASVGAVKNYTFIDVTQDHAISASFAINPLVRLTVVSDRGGASPGSVTDYTETTLTESITNSPVSAGLQATQYVCMGAVMTANAFTQVTPTNVTLTLTNTATLTWQWETQYWLNPATHGSGTVAMADEPWASSLVRDLQNANLGGTDVDCSGAAIMPGTGELLVIENGVPRIHVYDPDGNFKRTIPLNGFIDTEGLCHVRGDTFAVVEESRSTHTSNTITLVTITGAITNIAKASGQAYDVVGVPYGHNLGLEGIAYDAARNVFYAVKETTPAAVYRIVLTNGAAVATTLFAAPSGCNDFSDLCYDPVAEQLYLLSHEPSEKTSPIIRQTTLGGVVLSTKTVADPESPYQPEGMTMSPDRVKLYVVCESDELIRYRFPRQPGAGWRASGSKSIMTATPAAAWTFAGWSGATNGCTVAGNVITVPMNQACTVTANFRVDRPTLAVASLHGTPIPGGTVTQDWNTAGIASVNTPVVNGTTQYVCTGWTGTGSVPASGTSNSVSFNLTQDSTLTWQWRTNYWVKVSSGDHGSVAGTQGWYTAGAAAAVEAKASNYYRFAMWTGTVVSATNPLVLWVYRPHAVVANFTEALATNGIPLPWLVEHGFTNGAWDVLALADSDADGLWNWQEWRAGTDPTNPRSVLSLSPVALTPEGRLPLTFAAVAGKTYQVWKSSDLTGRNWAVAPYSPVEPGGLTVDPISGTGAAVTVFVQPDGVPCFYRVGVR